MMVVSCDVMNLYQTLAFLKQVGYGYGIHKYAILVLSNSVSEEKWVGLAYNTRCSYEVPRGKIKQILEEINLQHSNNK